MPGHGQGAEPLVAAAAAQHAGADGAGPDAEAVGLARALESERAARSALTDQLEQSRREAERLLVQRQALEREVTALHSASRGASSVQRSEYTSNLLEATAEAVFWRNSCEAAEARAAAAEESLRALQRQMALVRVELEGLRGESAALRTCASAEAAATEAEARRCLLRAGAALAAEREGRVDAEDCARHVFAAMTDSTAEARKRNMQRRAVTGQRRARVPKLVSFKAEGPLAALADAAALELAADSSATLALALDALRAAAAEPAALGAGSSAASSAAAAGAAAGSAGLAGAGWVVAAATLPSREVGRLVGRGGETVKRISEAVDGVLVADALRESRAGKKAAAPDHTACVVACPAAKLDVAAQEVGRAASNAATLARTLLPDAAVSAARKDLHAAEAAAAASPAPSDGAAAAGAAGASPAEDADSAAVFFRPEGVAGHNGAAGLSAVLEPVARATKSVDVAVYGLTDDVVRNALMAAHQRGVAVRVIVDKEQAEEPGADAKWLAEQGVQVAEAPGSEDGRLFHHKVILADAAVMVTGSLNLTKHASHANWENMVVSAEPAAVASFQAEFNRLWALCGPQASAADRGASLLAGPPSADSPLVQAAAGSGGAAAGGGAFAAGRTESIFFPCGEEGLKRLCKYMASAKTSLDMAALALTSDRVREAVQARHAAGVQVRVLADRSKSTEPGSDLAWLGKQSVPVRCARPTGDESSLFHHKFFVVDDHTVVTGSFNLTASAAERNFESVVVMASKGAAARFTAEFDTLWDAAVQL
ncbi:hypothetical protein FNF27_04063 [Cafeteria roenbergensis]|uniref:Mitochondrial cardiolipin hydrolase n=1 Tax=Cafeteria roenbergensis TaxID=33653 RepID=A0A5A8ECJ4_CAFRO|nr:hypothetical protein FNF27_04063 [Cafeteria roenbergensis]